MITTGPCPRCYPAITGVSPPPKSPARNDFADPLPTPPAATSVIELLSSRRNNDHRAIRQSGKRATPDTCCHSKR